jgi:hypothetical protein
MNGSNDLLEFLRIAYKWRKSIIAVTAIAAVASVILSVTLMDDWFKSSVTFYPSNPTMTDRQVMFGQAAGENQIDYFGGNSDIDRILTLSQTSGTIDYIINRYKLFDHYGYDTTARYGRYKTRLKFEKNYNARKTVLGAVEISVWDKDKELAADMANHIALTVDNKNRDMINKERYSIIEKLAERITEKTELVNKLSAEVDGDLRGAELDAKQIELDYAVEDLNDTKRLHEEYSTSVNLDISTINITEAAFPALRKDKPKRSLVCAGYTLGAFFFSLILVLFIEKYRQLKPELEKAA